MVLNLKLGMIVQFFKIKDHGDVLAALVLVALVYKSDLFWSVFRMLSISSLSLYARDKIILNHTKHDLLGAGGNHMVYI